MTTFGTILLAAATLAGPLLASAQSTTTYSTSTSWALLDNTDLFPKQTTTPASYSSSSSSTPSTTTTGDGFQITPPIPCPGIYYTYGGVCCRGNTLLDCDYDALYSGQQKPSSCCPAGQFVWALPLGEEQMAQAEARGDYSGCPGNMRDGVCCSGGVIYRDDGAEACSLGSVVWVETTGAGGAVGRSSVMATAAAAATSATTGISTTSGGMGTRATATAMGGGGSSGGGLAGQGRAWWGAVLVGGALGRW